MHISIVTLFPELYTAFLRHSLIGRAQEKGIVRCQVRNMLDACQPKERVDGPVFGHGAGMVIKPEVIERLIEDQEACSGPSLKIFFSPRGRVLDQDYARRLADRMSKHEHTMFFAARYEGMDARIEEEYADEIVSAGNFVLMGGDIPVQMTLEAVLRYLPDIVGKAASVVHDSFTGAFVDAPAYTAPVVWKEREVPPVLRSGDHARIHAWEQENMVQESVMHHFAWLRSHKVSHEQKKHILQTIPPHYVALMHDEVLLPHGEGTTSVTSLDIHDIARSSKTYGFRGFFIVTPLKDQQKIAQKLLSFWQHEGGGEYNPDRQTALATTSIIASCDDVIAHIEQHHGQKPVVITTSAQSTTTIPLISYYEQERVWQEQRPVLLLLGTGRGLAPRAYVRASYQLLPLEGYADFNHLSVRSAAAVIFDRWLGINLKKP
jgi:tRNA (guanine37-N1)-methyltransferase